MKKSLLTLICAMVVVVAFPQKGTFYLAKDLHALYNEDTRKIAVDAAALKAIAELLNKKTVTVAELNANPFWKNLFEDVPGASTGGFLGKAFKSIGGVDVTQIANVISDIMIERAKQELTVAFFDRFKSFADDNPEFKILFPKTTDNLHNLLTHAYPQMLPALRSGFFDDIKQVTYHLDDVLELPRYRQLLNNFPGVRVAIRSLRIVHDLEDGTSTIADVIKGYAQFPEWSQGGSMHFRNMGATVKFAAVFSEGLRFKDGTRIWVPAREIKPLLQDAIFVRIYMGFVYEQIKQRDITFYPSADTTKGVRLAAILDTQKENIFLFQNKLSEFSSLADQVWKAYGEIKTKQEDKASIAPEEVYNYMNLSIDVADYAFSIVKIFDEKWTSDEYMTVVKKANSLYRGIYSQQYTRSVNDAVDLLREVHQLTLADPRTDTTAVPSGALGIAPGLGQLLAFVQKIKPYALFMANIVDADTDTEVKAALENVILPVGSSSIKKHAKGNLSVQSYLGGYYTTNRGSASLEGVWSDKFGVTAPIGIGWTPGFTSWGKRGSLSLFGALFDLGAIVDYKLKKEPDPTSTSPGATVLTKEYKIELGQIFSPGIHLVYGFGWNLPLSIGFGAQYGPGLSKVEVSNDKMLRNPSWRGNFFLAVDLPFFTLSNRPKNQ